MSAIGSYLGAALGSIALPYVIVYLVIARRRRLEVEINNRRAAAWLAVSILVLAVFQAIADLFGYTGQFAQLMLTLPIPMVVSWYAVMLAANPVAPPAISPADELRQIRPK